MTRDSNDRALSAQQQLARLGRRFIRALVGWFLMLPGWAALAAQDSLLTLIVDPAAPSVLHAEYWLPEQGAPRSVRVRGTDFGLSPQVEAVTCDGQLVPTGGRGRWAIPTGCRRLHWQIAVASAEPGKTDLSLQQTLYFAEPGWWLLSEATSLLVADDGAADHGRRLQARGLPASAALFGGTDTERPGLRRLPALGAPPEFFAVGHAPLAKRNVGGLPILHVMDRPDRVRSLDLLELHEALMRRLVGLWPAEQQRAKAAGPPLLVVWSGVDPALGRVGGAAGSLSFLANYLDDGGPPDPLDQVRNLSLLAHEQFHQLDARFGTQAARPTWLNESLAQHFALAALRGSRLDPGAVDEVVNHFVDPARPIEMGLCEMERRVQTGERALYPRFYYQGATLWAEMDARLRATGQSLASQLPALLAAAHLDGCLADEVRHALDKAAGGHARTLIGRYVDGR